MVICPTRTDGRPRRPTRRRLATSALLAALCAAAGALLVAPAAFAKTYSDVPKSYWDRGAITWVTNDPNLSLQTNGSTVTASYTLTGHAPAFLRILITKP